MAEEQEEGKNIISKHDFYFETALYDVVELNALEENSFTGGVDAYSARNESETTYSVNKEGIALWRAKSASTQEYIDVGFYIVTLTCKRKGNDILRFIIYKDDSIVFKIGQYPSLADLQYAEIGKKYDKVLPKQDLHDLKKAIGLMAHGAGAGALVYLRRIFENIIWGTFIKEKQTLKISDEDFKRKRMNEKVIFLKDYLPNQLVEMKEIYEILSKGVHELSEEECLTYFPALKLSTLLILDEKIEKFEKEEKDALTKKAIADIASQLKNKII